MYTLGDVGLWVGQLDPFCNCLSFCATFPLSLVGSQGQVVEPGLHIPNDESVAYLSFLVDSIDRFWDSNTGIRGPRPSLTISRPRLLSVSTRSLLRGQGPWGARGTALRTALKLTNCMAIILSVIIIKGLGPRAWTNLATSARHDAQLAALPFIS